MLADQLDFVVGVDSHRDVHAVAVVAVSTGVVVFESSISADAGGYQDALRLAVEHAPGRRAFAIEGTASYGAGLSRFLLDHDEQVFEVGRPRRERRSGGKTDALDAIRAARTVLTQKRGAVPRSSGEREALRALMAAREGAAIAKQAGLNQLYALLVTTPEPVRGRPEAQPGTAPDPPHAEEIAPAHDRLHRAPHERRQDTPRSKPLPQALPRPQPLPPTREPANDDLTNIEASLAQATGD